jgi:glycosyltransferase involved in cell wall biosynthesis
VRVGLNLLYLIPRVVGGTETYARGLIGGFDELRSDEEFVIFLNQEASEWNLPFGRRFERVVCAVGGRSRIGRYLYEQVSLRAQLRRCGVHLVHSLGYVAPVFPGCPSVVTVPDMHFLAYGRRESIMRTAVLESAVRMSVARASHVLTISEFSSREISQHLGVSRERITVTYLAPERKWAAAAADESKREAGAAGYFVAFSSRAPNKNIPCLAKAFSVAKERGLKQRLVIVGHVPSDLQLSGIDGIETAGFLDEESLVKTVTGADCLVFPSTYEGFGLPVLEAMSAGVPVACSDRASLPEVGGEAPRYFDPDSADSIAHAMCEVGGAPDLRRRMRVKGFENVKRFSWARTASETLAVYREVLLRGGQAKGPLERHHEVVSR